MKELIVKIPEDSAGFITSLLKKLGAEIEQKNNATTRKAKTVVSPTFLFGKWANLDLDAKELRNKVWNRSRKF